MSLERSLVCACAAPAASLPVAVQIRQNVAPLADSPSLDELSDEPSPEGGSVALQLVVSGHGRRRYLPVPRPRESCPRGGGVPPHTFYYALFTRVRACARRIARRRVRAGPPTRQGHVVVNAPRGSGYPRPFYYACARVCARNETAGCDAAPLIREGTPDANLEGRTRGRTLSRIEHESHDSHRVTMGFPRRRRCQQGRTHETDDHDAGLRRWSDAGKRWRVGRGLQQRIRARRMGKAAQAAVRQRG